jgi:hypothetical protein
MGRAKGGTQAVVSAGGGARHYSHQQPGDSALLRAWKEDRARDPRRPLHHEITRDDVLISGSDDQANVSYSGPQREAWRLHRDGPLHRENKPALIEMLEDGTRIESYYFFGERHRIGGPAYIETHTDGTVIEKYYSHDEHHRENKPALIMRLPDGSREESYFLHNKFTGRAVRIAPSPRDAAEKAWLQPAGPSSR